MICLECLHTNNLNKDGRTRDIFYSLEHRSSSSHVSYITNSSSLQPSTEKVKMKPNCIPSKTIGYFLERFSADIIKLELVSATGKWEPNHADIDLNWLAIMLASSCCMQRKSRLLSQRHRGTMVFLEATSSWFLHGIHAMKSHNQAPSTSHLFTNSQHHVHIGIA